MTHRPATPCVNVCVLDAGGTCVGCRRTIDEIARWGSMSAAEQWQVVERLERERGESQQNAATSSPPAQAGR
jgi:predicted Fe-S protein YdhL (DUF1289 family)